MGAISILIFFITMLFSLFPFSMGLCMTGEKILAEIQNRYEKTHDFEARFTQEYMTKMMKPSHRGEGKVYFKKKGMMRWDYTTPNQKLISDGYTFWYYQPEEKQVLVSEVSSILNEKTPLAFLAGKGNLYREFNLLNLSESASQKEDYYVIDLSPKETLSTMRRLTLWVNKKTFYILQADVFDDLGNVTRTRFEEIRTNQGLSDSLFHFNIPPGTEVIKMQGTY